MPSSAPWNIEDPSLDCKDCPSVSEVPASAVIRDRVWVVNAADMECF